MCLCTPDVRTPFCGKPGCEWHRPTRPAVPAPASRGPITLEIGQGLALAYAGMLLAEQGHRVTKYAPPRETAGDPVHSMEDGDLLWQWVNHGKQLVDVYPQALTDEGFWRQPAGRPQIVLEDVDADELKRIGLDPAKLARDRGVVWVSIRSEVRDMPELQAEHAWCAETLPGLLAAFKAVASLGRPGYYPIGRASAFAKLTPGELTIGGDWGGSTAKELKKERDVPGSKAWTVHRLWHEAGRVKI
jgi:hypothetical protein